MTTTDEDKANFGVVCSITGKPADLFVRGNEGRLVPLIRPIYERLSKGRENLLPSLEKLGKTGMIQLLEGSFEELSLEEHSDEYWEQTPNVKEEKRRKVIEIVKDLDIILGIWSKGDLVSDEDLAERLKKEEKEISDYHISRLSDYPKSGIHTVIVANKLLDEDSIKLIWKEHIKAHSSN